MSKRMLHCTVSVKHLLPEYSRHLGNSRILGYCDVEYNSDNLIQFKLMQQELTRLGYGKIAYWTRRREKTDGYDADIVLEH